MKKIKYGFAALLATTMMSCGGGESTEDTTSNEENTTEEVVPQAETLEAFTKEKLAGNWLATEASGYSRDKIKGQTYTFDGDTASVYKSSGEGGMATGFYELTDGTLSVQIKKQNDDGSTSTVFCEYKGGFTADGDLKLTSNSESITLEKQ